MSDVMRSALVLAMTLALGCTTSVRGRSEELCLWPESWWDDQAALHVRGTNIKLGRARKFWSNGAWHGAFVSGALKRSESNVVFEGRWQAHGLQVDADLLVADEPVFTAWTPTRIGAAAALTRGTPVRLLDARPGEVLVRPTERAMNTLVTPEPMITTLRCEDLSLKQREGDDALAAVTNIGFRRDAERVRIKSGDEVVLAEAPSGGVVGAVAPGTIGFVVGKKNDAIRVAAVSDGVVLVGWAPVASVEAVTSEPVRAEPEAAQSALQSGLVWRQCEDPVPIHVYDGEGLGPRVGLLEPRRRLATRLRTPTSKTSVVVLESNWFEVDANVTLLTPLDLSQCTSVIGPW